MTDLLRTGIDCQDGRVVLARVDNGGERPVGKTLGVVEGDCPAGHDCLCGSAPILVVPDREVIVKLMLVPGTEKVHDRRLLEFELAACMLESERNFVFDAIPTGFPQQHLGLVYRRERLAQLYDRIGLWPKQRFAAGRCRARSVALGRGFMSFCQQLEDELVCLIDIAGEDGSVCLLRHGDIVNVGCFGASGLTDSDPETTRRIAIEAKTIVSFKLASLGQGAGPMPPPRLLLSGESVSPAARDIFADYFAGEIGRPQLDMTRMTPDIQAPTNPECWLAALGAAVK